MPMRQTVPLLILGGVAAVSASALAGVGIGRYTVSGVNPFYMDSYRPLAARADTAEAFWSAQGQPAPRPTFAAFEAYDAPAPEETTL